MHMNTNAADSNPGQRPDFELTQTWPAIGEGDGEDLLAFWKTHGAIPNETEARKRLKQVAVLARDDSDAVAGVCTAVPMTPAQLGQPVYYWRCFVAPEWRSTRLFYQMGIRSFELLESWAREHDFPCIGILLELENDRFGKIGRMPVWGRSRFTYIGKSARGLDVRIRYFEGARLK